MPSRPALEQNRSNPDFAYFPASPTWDTIEIHRHRALDLDRPLNTALVVDDEECLCRFFGEALCDTLPQTVVFSAPNPARAIPLLDFLYFDLAVSDIMLPGIRGHEFLGRVRGASPTTFTFAMTAEGTDAGYLAGLCRPDRFMRKCDGTTALTRAMAEGVVRNHARRSSVFVAPVSVTAPGQPSGRPRLSHWRKVRRIKQTLGFHPNRILFTHKLLRAYCLQNANPEIGRETLAVMAGFSSFQRLKPHLERLKSHLSNARP